jgi:hypothetical protein
MTEGTEWQARAKAVGLDQETIRRLLRMTKATASNGIRGKRKSGVSREIKLLIVACELMTPEMRAELFRIMENW